MGGEAVGARTRGSTEGGQSMTVAFRLEALERGQVEILDTIGDVKADVGELKGMMAGWIDERRLAQASADALSDAIHRECEVKHQQVDRRLSETERLVSSTHDRVKVIEKWKDGQIAGWSTAKKIVVGLAFFMGMVGTTLGVAEAISRLVG
jgi:hypothetical protein